MCTSGDQKRRLFSKFVVILQTVIVRPISENERDSERASEIEIVRDR